MQKKAIVVTGAAGFIGSCIVKHLNLSGHENLILVDDILQTEKWKNLLGKKFAELIPIQSILEYLEPRKGEIEGIIHLGACSDTLETNGDYIMENNYRYSQRLALFALKNGIRFIYASSAATYGDGSLGFSDDHALLQDLRPLNLYGYSKHLFDLWLLRQGLLDQVVGLKYFNVFGPNENHKGRMSSIVHQMVPTVQRDKKMKLFKSTDPENFKDGEQCRDFIYVKDVAKMTCDFLNNAVGGIFNIGTGDVTTWNQLSQALFAALDLAPCIEYVEMPAELSRQYQNYTCASMEKYCRAHNAPFAKPELQFRVEEAVQDYVRNYLVKGERW